MLALCALNEFIIEIFKRTQIYICLNGNVCKWVMGMCVLQSTLIKQGSVVFPRY